MYWNGLYFYTRILLPSRLSKLKFGDQVRKSPQHYCTGLTSIIYRDNYIKKSMLDQILITDYNQHKFSYISNFMGIVVLTKL